MSSILVQSPGLLTTVQDFGREGYGPAGVSPSGAADPVALRLGNLLVGNKPGAAALEMTLIGGSFVFPQGATIALAGADFPATIEGASLNPWRSHRVPPGGTVSVGPTQGAARCYLCISGGIKVPPFLGSASTHLLSGLGGWQGRSLQKGDVLQLGQPAKNVRPGKISSKLFKAWQPRKVLRVTEGPQWEWFSVESHQQLCEKTFRVSEVSNRMGLRLEGPPLTFDLKSEMISEGVALGALQVTPSGQPIILFVEQQTAGGYPKIANVIGADLHCIGQLRPRDEIRFQLVSFQKARTLLVAHQKLFAA
jgi:antagonist of KipI